MRPKFKVILLVKPEGAYDRRLLLGIARYAHLHGPWSIFHEVEEHKRDLHYVRNWGADGIIADIRESKKLQQAVGDKTPIITIGASSEISIYPNISSDSQAIGKIGAEHFLDRGFRHFAFLSFDDIEWSRRRALGFSKRISEAGYKIHTFKRRYIGAKRSWSHEQALLATWLEKLPTPLGLMACNDEAGRHVLEASKVAGLDVPGEVAVLGVDNDEIICSLTDPPLSSIHLNTEVAGYEAAELLAKLMTGRKVAKQQVVVQPARVETRVSTDVLALDDREVAEALRFIRENARRPLQVADVADAVALSRRRLYVRFQETLNLSVSRQIRIARIRLIARMLIETNLSIAKIAMEFGFGGPEKLSRYFKRETGLTPLDYRRKNRLP